MFDNTVDWCIENIFKKYAEYKEKKLRQEIDEKMKELEQVLLLKSEIEKYHDFKISEKLKEQKEREECLDALKKLKELCETHERR
jgi:hypothetical protein